MRIAIPLAAVLGSLALLSACGRDEGTKVPAAAPDTAATGAPAEQAGTTAPGDVSPMKAQAWLDDFSIGSELAADGSIAAGKTGDDFAPGQAVNVAAEVKDAPVGTSVKVIWFGPNEMKVGEEEKQVASGEKYINFSAKDTKAWQKGDYRAEFWVGDEKVNAQQFNIVDASKAAG